MTSKQRRDHEKTAVRERIVVSAMNLLKAEGASGVTMRRVAEAMDYTAPVVYQHFANKDDLIGELVRQGYSELVARLDAAHNDTDPDTRLSAVAAEYLRFAAENEHLFEAMNGTALPPDVRLAAARPAIGVLSQLVDDWAERHRVELEAKEAYEIIWGTLYGIAALGRLGTIGPTQARQLGVRALELLLRGWSCGK
ncbi:TetR/AcrR family transcriptional regulator [Mycetocola zhujimingii]|uniref:TetR family transcriptional regulator n=1 Tax=Mycetocola zhujimingii TaxID=2079792 RepID=A0A2U1TID1_9MICO|nr:TetR/AcrR family transcriptional regulator [Mycetocola zhujimingii]PWC08606.1 TetR family transcriptional regulator [Mycetocola zhujimingii]